LFESSSRSLIIFNLDCELIGISTISVYFGFGYYGHTGFLKESNCLAFPWLLYFYIVICTSGLMDISLNLFIYILWGFLSVQPSVEVIILELWFLLLFREEKSINS
jgi:hypothetical protein